MKVEILDDKIVLKEYPFPVFGKRTRIIYSNEINFLKLDNDILSLCIKSKEILFIPPDYRDQFQKFVNQYNVTISDKVDVWELICYPFVNTNRTNVDMEENRIQLRKLSFEENEVTLIRKRINKVLSWYVTFSMEYSTLNHSDLLQARKNIYFFNPFWKKFYWFTMEIALKGYGYSQIRN